VTEIAGLFVWVKVEQPLKSGPSVAPEKWPSASVDVCRRGKTVIAEHKLGADEFSLSFAILEQRYPPPQGAE
jgi:hypothetical protein